MDKELKKGMIEIAHQIRRTNAVKQDLTILHMPTVMTESGHSEKYRPNADKKDWMRHYHLVTSKSGIRDSKFKSMMRRLKHKIAKKQSKGEDINMPSLMKASGLGFTAEVYLIVFKADQRFITDMALKPDVTVKSADDEHLEMWVKYSKAVHKRMIMPRGEDNDIGIEKDRVGRDPEH